jgi:hypothetical protein
VRRGHRAPLFDHEDSDPLSGIANLFDVSVVFIVGLIIALFGAFRLPELLDPGSEMTLVKTNAQGETEILIKKGMKIEAYKVAEQEGAGKGRRLGTAYQLANGEMIYVPETSNDAPR